MLQRFSNSRVNSSRINQYQDTRTLKNLLSGAKPRIWKHDPSQSQLSYWFV